MLLILIIPVIIIFLFLIALILHNQKLIIEEYNIKFVEATNSIDILHDKHIKILTDISKLINKDCNEKILKDLIKIKNKDFDMFELQNELHKLNVELKNFIQDNNYNFGKNHKLKKDFDSNVIEINSLINYYNQVADNYNQIIKKFKFLIIKLIKKLKPFNLFVIEKEIEFEILKNES